MRMSFMLLGMPQNKNNAVTKMNGKVLPGENSRGSSFAFGPAWTTALMGVFINELTCSA
jgi:hypothetical protein